MSSVIDTVVFDLGNVVVRFDPELLYRKLIPDANERHLFLSQVCTTEWHERHDVGIGFTQNAAPLLRKHSKDQSMKSLIQAWGWRFGEMLDGPIQGTVEIIRDLKAMGIKLYALSNWSHEFFADADKRFGFSSMFEDLVVSGKVGVKKPDPKIYRLLIEKTGLTPQSTAFVDDRKVNLPPAAALGITPILFTEPDALAINLRKLGISLPDRKYSL